MPLRGFADISKPKEKQSTKHKFKVVDLAKYEGTAQYFRPVGYVYAENLHWVERNVNGKTKVFATRCCNYNPDTDKYDDNGCPWCKANVHSSKRYYVRVINRDAVDNEPKKLAPRTDFEKKKHTMDGIEDIHYKEDDSRSWSPVEVLSLPAGAARKLQDLEELKGWVTSKKTGKKKFFNFGDAKFGCDISIIYDKSKKADAYQISFEKRSTLTEEELNYLYPSFEEEFPAPDLAHEKEEFEKIKDTLILNNDDSEQQAQKTISSLPDEDDDDEDEEDRIPDEDFETPKKKKKVVEEDDEDDEELEDSEDEDESDDIDEDEDDEDEEEEQPKKKKKSKSDDDDGFDF